LLPTQFGTTSCTKMLSSKLPGASVNDTVKLKSSWLLSCVVLTDLNFNVGEVDDLFLLQEIKRNNDNIEINSV
jgi:hypothetical protein